MAEIIAAKINDIILTQDMILTLVGVVFAFISGFWLGELRERYK